MKFSVKLILLAVGFAGFLVSCQCKNCTKTNEPNIQICKGEGTDQEYNDAIDFAQTWQGYTCQ
jgi:hypothetical protein